MGGESSGNSLNDKMMDILSRIEYRRVECFEDLEEIGRLRYLAYSDRGIVTKSREMIDEADFDPHAHVLALYYEGRLLSSVRLHHVTPEHRLCQSASDFGSEIAALLDARRSFIDPARFAADPEAGAEFSWIPYMTLRPAIAAAAFFGADLVMQHVQTRHASFYKRVFYADTIVGSKYCPQYLCDLSLMCTDTRRTGPALLTRFPFFKTRASERTMLFARDGSPRYFNALPTARFIGADDLSYVLPPRNGEAIFAGD
jgi:N-acyl-L-homoserine lactone synthetase